MLCLNSEYANRAFFCSRERLTVRSQVPDEDVEKAWIRPHGYLNKLPVRSKVGARGFEPPTSRTRSIVSNPGTLRLMDGCAAYL
jgi:hypothetical protein